jgi:hypothetical protein
VKLSLLYQADKPEPADRWPFQPKALLSATREIFEA